MSPVYALNIQRLGVPALLLALRALCDLAWHSGLCSNMDVCVPFWCGLVLCCILLFVVL